MNYRHPELRERLAAEYVLGTLKSGARRRFERLMMEDASLRQVVWQWEQRLNPLAEQIPPQTPPAHLWKQIEKRIAPPTVAPGVVDRWQWIWKGWSLTATAATLALAVYAGQLARVPAPEYVAVFNDTQAKPVWLVSLNDDGQLSVRALNTVAQADKSYELWSLPPGAAPKSLGLLPASGRLTRAVHAVLDNVDQTPGLAVSLEPVGGSPSGLPTGPVLYQSQLISL